MRRFAVLGAPIQHSLSPVLHNFLYKKLDLPAGYERFEVAQGELKDFLALHNSKEWQGFSLTMPLKEEGIRHCDSLADEALEATSINTLKRVTDGWRGYNTDVFGFRFLLEKIMEAVGSEKYGDVSILGAGGTARAALVALRDSGSGIKVFRRNSERDSQLLRANQDIKIFDWSEVSTAFESAILINCAPVDAMSSIASFNQFKGFLLDSLYSPWPTPLMRIAQSKFFSGKDLLVAQAIRQFEIFLDLSLERDSTFTELRALI
jgi:shikimate dehydrogenase